MVAEGAIVGLHLALCLHCLASKCIRFAAVAVHYMNRPTKCMKFLDWTRRSLLGLRFNGFTPDTQKCKQTRATDTLIPLV